MLPDSELQSAPRRFRHLSKFIDRVTEYHKFDTLVKNAVDARDKFILAFYGPPGIGKSMLLQRLEFECTRRNIANARIILDQGGDMNIPTEIMRHLALQLSEEEFGKWFEVERYWFSPPEINIQAQQGSVNVRADQVDVRGDVGRDFVVGSKVEISNSQINVTTRAALTPQAAQTALTQTFLQVLGEFVKKKPAVMIFDGFDSPDFFADSRRWLTNNLLDKTRDFGGFGVLPVVGLLDRPSFSDPSLQDDIAQFMLKPLSREHIVEYFQIRRLPEEIIVDAAETCLSQTQGLPSRVYGFVEALLNPSEGS